VPVDDKRTVTLPEVEKFITNPEKVLRGLLRQRNAGSQSRVHEQKVTAGEAVLKATEKEIMRFRKILVQTTMNVELRCIQIGV